MAAQALRKHLEKAHQDRWGSGSASASSNPSPATPPPPGKNPVEPRNLQSYKALGDSHRYLRQVHPRSLGPRTIQAWARAGRPPARCRAWGPRRATEARLARTAGLVPSSPLGSDATPRAGLSEPRRQAAAPGSAPQLPVSRTPRPDPAPRPQPKSPADVRPCPTPPGPRGPRVSPAPSAGVAPSLNPRRPRDPHLLLMADAPRRREARPSTSSTRDERRKHGRPRAGRAGSTLGKSPAGRWAPRNFKSSPEAGKPDDWCHARHS